MVLPPLGKPMLVIRCIIHLPIPFARPPFHSRLNRPSGQLPARSAGIADKTDQRQTVELILIVMLLMVLFGGGFGFYRGGYFVREVIASAHPL